MVNLVLEADNKAYELKDAVEKVQCIAETMANDFYNCKKPETDLEKTRMFQKYKSAYIELNIIIDYLSKLNSNIDALLEILNNIPEDAAYAKEGDSDE